MSLEPLAQDIAWLYQRLDESIATDAKADIERLRDIAEGMLTSGKPDPALGEYSLPQFDAVLKLISIRFHLRNKAEQLHITRVNRARALAATRETPRAESLAEAVETLAADGKSLQDLLAILGELDIQPTLTAHPTESRRRSVIAKQDRIGELLFTRNHTELTTNEGRVLQSDVRQTLSQLMATDEIRSRRLDVIDEVRNGIHYLSGSIWRAIPRLYRDLALALETYYGEWVELPVMVRYRSWIGGDRDGNPFVTAKRTAVAFKEMRETAIARHHEALEALHRELSLSSRRVAVDPALIESIEADQAAQPLEEMAARHLEREPFRLKLSHMQARLGTPDYHVNQFIEDLRVIERALVFAGFEETATRGGVTDAIVAARTFGFHLAALDFRQHSRVHERAVSELFTAAGIHSDYGSLEEAARTKALEEELSTQRTFNTPEKDLSEETRELLNGLKVFAEAIERDPDSVGTYIISMAHEVSDLLEVLLLLREVGLWSNAKGTVESAIDVAPLFETVDDLDRSGVILQAMIDHPIYASQLAARDRFQEIMLGYSDSNKDGGYWAANWRLHTAQEILAEIANRAGISFRFFHGRGGTVARGGGRANRAILASPPETRNGRIRFTEQGEVISFRYAMPAVANRHLEQILSAMILATRPPGTFEDSPTADNSQKSDDAFQTLMNQLAESSRRTYRRLVDEETFWPTFVAESPVLHIGELPIASRPVSRSGTEITFDNLRAIPWVFAWTQMRYNVPGWYGIGEALGEHVLADTDRLHACQAAYQAGGFFRAFIDNAQQEMARARLEVSGWYRVPGDDGFYSALKDEFERAREAILLITGQARLLDNNPVIQQSIRERNSDTDIINAIQVELLKRWREGEHDQALNTLILLSVNALAAAMQSTG